MKRNFRKETIVKMANDLGFNLYTDCGRIYLEKENEITVKKGFSKTYYYLYNIKKKNIA
jgi:hypothetical protein